MRETEFAAIQVGELPFIWNPKGKRWVLARPWWDEEKEPYEWEAHPSKETEEPRPRSTLKLKVLQLVDGGTVASEGIAKALGMDRKHITRHLLNYRRRGLLRLAGSQPGRSKKRAYVYELTRTGRRQMGWLAEHL